MTPRGSYLTTRVKLGVFLLLVPVVAFAFAMSPGWGFDLLGGWPTVYYQVIAGVFGLVGGALLSDGPKVSVAALIGGMLGEVGALTAAAWHLSAVQETTSFAIVLVAGVGAAPGFIVAQLLAPIEDRIRRVR